MQINFLEHVLVSQQSSAIYPIWVCLATSALGIASALSLHEHQFLSVLQATALAAMYCSKTVRNLADEMFHPDAYTELMPPPQAMLLNGGRPHATTAAFISVVTQNLVFILAWLIFQLWFEKAQKKVRQSMAITLAAIVGVSGLIFFLMSRYQLAVLCSMLGMKRPSVVQTSAVAVLLTAVVALTCIYVFARVSTPARVSTMLRAMVVTCVAVIALDPSLESLFGTEPSDDASDVIAPPFASSQAARWAGVLLALYYLLMRVLPLPPALTTSTWFRIATWMLQAKAATIVLCGVAIPFVDWKVQLCLALFAGLTSLMLYMAHFMSFERDAVIYVELGALAAMILAFLALNYVDLSAVTQVDAYIVDAHVTGRTGLLAIATCINLAAAVVLKLRVLIRPVFTGTARMSMSMFQQIALALNYTALLGTVTMLVLVIWIGDNNPALVLCGSGFLLLLHDDMQLFTELGSGVFRYFPSYAFGFGWLFFSACREAFYRYGGHKRHVTLFMLVQLALVVVPTGVTIAYVLNAGYRDQHTRRLSWGALLLMWIVNGVVLLLAESEYVRWLAVLNVLTLKLKAYDSMTAAKRSAPLL